MMPPLKTYMLQRFGHEWDALSGPDRGRVLADFAEMCRDEYDVDDPLNIAAEENVQDASMEYRRRIGDGNLQAHADSLAAGRPTT